MKVTKSVPFALIALSGLILSFSQPGYSAGPKQKNSAMAPMTPETKKDMSDMYAKMAECMKTEKSMEDCQKDVMKDCPMMKSTGHCPLMEGMKPMMGKSKMQEKMGKEMNH